MSASFDTLQTILMGSTMFGEELVSNKGNADILQCLLKSFKIHRSQLYSRKASIPEAFHEPLSPEAETDRLAV